MRIVAIEPRHHQDITGALAHSYAPWPGAITLPSGFATAPGPPTLHIAPGGCRSRSAQRTALLVTSDRWACNRTCPFGVRRQNCDISTGIEPGVAHDPSAPVARLEEAVATIRFLAQVRGRWDRLGGRTLIELIESISVLVDKATGEDNSKDRSFTW